jgi:hypothetical protein
MNAEEARQATKKVKDDQLKEALKQAEIQIQDVNEKISQAINSGKYTITYAIQSGPNTPGSEIAHILANMLKGRGFTVSRSAINNGLYIAWD